MSFRVLRHAQDKLREKYLYFAIKNLAFWVSSETCGFAEKLIDECLRAAQALAPREGNLIRQEVWRIKFKVN